MRRFTLAGLKRQRHDNDTLSNWRDRPRPDVKAAEQGSHITGDTGKVVEDERESEGSTVARKRSNFRVSEEALLVAKREARLVHR